MPSCLGPQLGWSKGACSRVFLHQGKDDRQDTCPTRQLGTYFCRAVPIPLLTWSSARNRAGGVISALHVQGSEPGKPYGNGFQRQIRRGELNGFAGAWDADRCPSEAYPWEDVKLGLQQGGPYGKLERDGYAAKGLRRDRTIRNTRSRSKVGSE